MHFYCEIIWLCWYDPKLTPQLPERPPASLKRFFQRKLAQRNRAVAVKATANKLAKACFYIMRDQVKYEDKLLFR